MTTFFHSLVILWFHITFTFALHIPSLSRRAEQIPKFVKDFAPLVFLDKEERHFPSDIATHLEKTTPFVDKKILEPTPKISIDNLDSLNQFNNNTARIFLTSIEGVEKKPAYLLGVQPDETGKTVGATSCVVIVTDHGDGSVDAFYMHFYSFDKGNTVLGRELGDHIADWEHVMVRFKNGSPEALWLSQHARGQAFTYKAMKKQGDRPIVFSARGTHALYSTDGDHDHTIPGVNLPVGPVEDHTSEGKLWDPLKNAFFYTFDPASNSFASVDNSPLAIVNFNGRWGDAQYSGSIHGQKSLFGFKKYVDGPTGPLDKNLNRKQVCPDKFKDCDIKDKAST
ncbi:putative vacuolar protein sorting-associated protein TDA6 [Erysiphe necator]|uniref:Putative vacuolar protein sorting-associated protein 62 protein n=1 Tax=Uncinula necator TaxID=52586 RepID=A0A0B1P4K8_UNCNE|nr:putative vacuolar protein sorting-associated protein TDA6 [Erysiphe necator]KHJ31614.1 putative vacuolar protein sorting-associated protein 62 protein [Erysiphe necator]